MQTATAEAKYANILTYFTVTGVGSFKINNVGFSFYSVVVDSHSNSTYTHLGSSFTPTDTAEEQSIAVWLTPAVNTNVVANTTAASASVATFVRAATHGVSAVAAVSGATSGSATSGRESISTDDDPAFTQANIFKPTASQLQAFKQHYTASIKSGGGSLQSILMAAGSTMDNQNLIAPLNAISKKNKVWLMPYLANFSNSEALTGFKNNLYGAMLGYTRILPAYLANLSFYGGYAQNNLHAKLDRNNKAFGNSYILGATLNKAYANNMFTNASVLMMTMISSNYRVFKPDAQQTYLAVSKPKNNAFVGTVTVGREFKVAPGSVVTPFLNANFNRLTNKAYQESNLPAVYAQQFPKSSSNNFELIPGISLQQMFASGSINFTYQLGRQMGKVNRNTLVNIVGDPQQAMVVPYNSPRTSHYITLGATINNAAKTFSCTPSISATLQHQQQSIRSAVNVAWKF